MMPIQDIICEFNSKAGVILKTICILQNEIMFLQNLQVLQLTQLTKKNSYEYS